MSWNDLGVIFKVDNLSNDWACSHFYTPTAILLDHCIRVFGALWDSNKHGRIGYVDVDLNEPYKIIDFSKTPVLADANKGTFDVNGTTPLSAILVGNELRLYYAGWQTFNLSHKRYTIFTGLAISNSEGKSFERYSEKNIIGPNTEKELVRTGYILRDNENWRIWFASFNKAIHVNGKITPSYNLSTMMSDDGINWNNPETIIFPIKENSIMGYGRSAVWKENNMYHGLFAVREWSGRYSNVLYYSSSLDGIRWGPLSTSNMAFKSSYTCDGQREVCSPSIIKHKNKMLMFYNGNDFGREGLRLAIWNS